jgi:hypothetical protein
MGQKELLSGNVMERVKRGQLTIRAAAKELNASYRPGRRIYAAYRAEGDKGLIQGNAGKPSNRKTADAIREQAVRAYREQYEDFGPTFGGPAWGNCSHVTEAITIGLRGGGGDDGMVVLDKDLLHSPTPYCEHKNAFVLARGTFLLRLDSRRCAVTLYFKYSTGEPMSFAKVKLYPPMYPEREILSSITDRNGLFGFIPDETEEWVGGGRGYHGTPGEYHRAEW